MDGAKDQLLALVSYLIAQGQTHVTNFSDHFHLTTLPLHTPQILTAFLVYETIYAIGSPVLSQLLAPATYGRLSARTKINWDVRVVSFVQALFISYAAAQVIAARPSETPRDERLWGYSSAAGRVQAFAAGYFLWDIAVSARHLKALGPGSLVHALAAATITIMGFRPFANHYGINYVLYELSNPFLNIHWFLDKFGQTGSLMQWCNGLCLVSTFFGCRLIWGSYQTALLSTDALAAWRESQSAAPSGWGKFATSRWAAGLRPREFPTSLLVIYLVGNAVLTVLNVYWFGLMLKALRKRFQTVDTKKTQ